MRTTQLLKRSLAYYWHTNLVVVLGVAAAVSVLAGALLIGESVRGSLRDLSARRLGKTDDVVSSANFFREQLATDLGTAFPLIALKGVVVFEPTKRRASDVKVYGVDERFWKFNGVSGEAAPQNGEALVSQSLASELGGGPGESLLLRLEKPSDIPVESLHGRKEDPGKTIRLKVARVLAGESLGEFSLQPQQDAVKAIFVSLSFLQRELEQPGRVNTILVSRQQQSVVALLKNKATLEDLGLKLRVINDQSISVESAGKIINEHVAAAVAQAAQSLSLRTIPVLSYLANSINDGDRSTPYSLVTAVDDETLAKLARAQATKYPPIILNDWTARDLNAKPGDTVSLDYYFWHENGRLETKRADFELTAVVPIAGIAADRELVPEYPGITASENLADWDPPFPINLERVRKEDEDYWHQYRATPKAFIPLSAGQSLWGTRFGKLTSIRVEATPEIMNDFSEKLRFAIDPALMGVQIVPVRDQSLAASRGATDFGEYFLYFSFFLVVSALMLTTLFFKLGIEQRAREVGTLQAIGFSDAGIRRLFLAEGTLLAIIGSLLGLIGAVAYAAFLMYGLRTWWVGAVGTTALTLHVSWVWMIVGALGGVAAAVVCIFVTLRRLGRLSTRSLLAGLLEEVSRKGTKADAKAQRRSFLFVPLLKIFAPLREIFFAIALTIIGIALLVAGALQAIPRVAAFFGGGVILLIAGVLYLSSWLKRSKRPPIRGVGWWTVARLGFRNATYRPGRTVLCITLIAAAAFIIVAVDSFRRSGVSATDRKSGTGGFPLLAESLLPVVHDLNTPAGREALNLTNDDTTFVSLRVRPGDDTSCLNLYQPRNPKIVAPPESFIRDNRFTFQSSIGSENDNPWLLLDRQFDNGAVPVIGDANSLTYVLHVKVGDELVIDHSTGPLRLLIVGALSDSIFQSELLMSEKNFLRLFPEQEGYRMFLIDAPNNEAAQVSTVLEDRLSDFGFDVISTTERLANFHRVENTYLSTFQMLGGLGLMLGTFGMAAVLLRNVFERRKELALLRAVGYNSSHFATMVITENVLMLVCGLAVGFVCALLAIAPVLFERGGRLPNTSLGLLLLAVLLSGAIASLVGTLAALRSPLLPSLRAE
jgi:ABC-type antimicrobial peptide transport system permease subunit